jgi:hypothetical protein
MNFNRNYFTFFYIETLGHIFTILLRCHWYISVYAHHSSLQNTNEQTYSSCFGQVSVTSHLRAFLSRDHMMIIISSLVIISHRYWNTLLDMFWPRFTFVVQQNVESIRLIDPQKMGTIDVQPHYVITTPSLYLRLVFTQGWISFKIVFHSRLTNFNMWPVKVAGV